MEFNDKVRHIILALREMAFDQDIDQFCAVLKERALELNIHYSILLKLVFDKNYLVLALNPQISNIDARIDVLQKEMEKLKNEKALLGEMVCEMYGHTIDYDVDKDKQYCKMCGEKIVLKNKNNFLCERNRLDQGFYPKR